MRKSECAEAGDSGIRTEWPAQETEFRVVPMTQEVTHER
jgi:hypothetical protein